MDITQKIRKFFSKFIKMDSIGNDDNVFELGLVNSLFTMQLIGFLENEFEVEISNDDLDLDNFKSVNAIVHFLKTKLS